MLKLNLMPSGELKELNAKHRKQLILLAMFVIATVIFASIVTAVKFHSLVSMQSELKKQVAELAKFDEHQKKTLETLKDKRAKFDTNLAQSGNFLDLPQFLRLLIHTKAKNVFLTEIKAVAREVTFSGFANSPSSAMDFSAQVKKSNLVQSVANFAITKVTTTNGQPHDAKCPLSFTMSVTLRKSEVAK